MQPGDVVLIKTTRKLQSPLYQLARIKQVKPDENGVVRSVVLEVRDRRRRQQVEVRELEMAVQRLAVLLPAEEAWEGGVKETL